MKRLTCVLLALMLLCGCAGQPQKTKYTATFLDVFNTVTSIMGLYENKETFEQDAQAVHDALLQYHRLFDIYEEYPGVVNLKTVNAQAGKAPVQVDRAILELLADCKAFYTATGGRVNVALGSVLQLWHEKRTDGLDDPANAALPQEAALKEAAKHCNLDQVILDMEASTVYFADPALQLDVGAVAKGWAAQRVAEAAPKGLLISVGGNVCATGAKDDQGTPWVVGVQDPNDSQNYLHTLYLSSGSVVTSGDYQRVYFVAGKPYHHIIDPDTLYPSEYWRSVTIVCADSGLADALSTALFLLPQDRGQELLDHFGAEAMWVDREGGIFYSPGFQDMIRT